MRSMEASTCNQKCFVRESALSRRQGVSILKENSSKGLAELGPLLTAHLLILFALATSAGSESPPHKPAPL